MSPFLLQLCVALAAVGVIAEEVDMQAVTNEAGINTKGTFKVEVMWAKNYKKKPTARFLGELDMDHLNRAPELHPIDAMATTSVPTPTPTSSKGPTSGTSTVFPTITSVPTATVTSVPTKAPVPTAAVTSIPTITSAPTAAVTSTPTKGPASGAPTVGSTAAKTLAPTTKPTSPVPTASPSFKPSLSPSRSPSAAPTAVPSTAKPTSAVPTAAPTSSKPVSVAPTSTAPTAAPTAAKAASVAPTASPTTGAPTTAASVNLIHHGGAVMNTVTSYALFWGTSWASTTYQGDKITGLNAFYTGFSGSLYAKMNTEYTGAGNTQFTGVTTHKGHWVDTSSAAAATGQTTSTILTEVCKMIVANGITPTVDTYVAVYTDQPRGTAGFCAWHSGGYCKSSLAPKVVVQIAFFFDLTGDSGCDPRDTSGLHSQPLAALASVSAHELSEAITDPAGLGGGWYNYQGEENGDMCAWSFGSPLVTFSDGNKWKLQGEWSNAANLNPTAFPTSYKSLAGFKGCLSGM